MTATQKLRLTAVLALIAVSSAANAATLELYPPSNVGIPYQWHVKMKAGETVQFINHVGAKSWNEPTTPGKGWTHTSDWVAFALTERARVTIRVDRQMGVIYGDPAALELARKSLYPALSIYRSWDTTSSVPHQYENSTNITGATVIYLGNVPNATGKASVLYEAILNAGRYTVAIGGNPPHRTSYPPANCDPATSVLCYVYSGNHGVRTTISTKLP